MQTPSFVLEAGFTHYLPAIWDGWWSESNSDRKRRATSICPGWGRREWMSTLVETTKNGHNGTDILEKLEVVGKSSKHDLRFGSPPVLLTTVKGLSGSLQHLQRESSNNICLSGDGLGSLHGLRPQRGDHLSPIDQSKALWGEDMVR